MLSSCLPEEVTPTSDPRKAVPTPAVVPTGQIPEGSASLETPSISPDTTIATSPPPRIARSPAFLPAMVLETQLPRDVWEEFHGAFYGTCSEPPFENLKVTMTWAGSEDAEIEFTPEENTYFLAVVGDPFAAEWEFDSILETSRRETQQSLHLDSNFPDELTDAQEWCRSGFGLVLPDALHIDATGVTWTVYLVSAAGSEPLPRAVAGALAGYYDCSPLPSVDRLEVRATWGSDRGITGRSLNFTGSPPYFFVGVRFEPASDIWYFRSANVSGDWRVAGPSVSSTGGNRIDFTATCPVSPSLHHLEVEAEGGDWTVYLIGVE